MPDLYQVGNALTSGFQSAQHPVFQIGSSSSEQRIEFSRLINLTQECIEIAVMAVVEFAGLTDLEQAQSVVSVVKTRAIVVQDQLLLLVRLVGESIRDNAT